MDPQRWLIRFQLSSSSSDVSMCHRGTVWYNIYFDFIFGDGMQNGWCARSGELDGGRGERGGEMRRADGG